MANVLTEKEKKSLWKFMITGAVFWSLAILLMIKKGFVDQTHSMPLTGINCLLAWKCIFVFIKPQRKPQIYINILLIPLDIVLLYQYFRYSSLPFISMLFPYASILLHTLIMMLCFLSVYFISNKFDEDKGKYTAFGMNFMISALFIQMLIFRGSTLGQSIWIALFKMLGSIFPSYCFYRGYPKDKLLNFMYFAIFVLDLTYFYFLYIAGV